MSWEKELARLVSDLHDDLVALVDDAVCEAVDEVVDSYEQDEAECESDDDDEDEYEDDDEYEAE